MFDGTMAAVVLILVALLPFAVIVGLMYAIVRNKNHRGKVRFY